MIAEPYLVLGNKNLSIDSVIWKVNAPSVGFLRNLIKQNYDDKIFPNKP